MKRSAALTFAAAAILASIGPRAWAQQSPAPPAGPSPSTSDLVPRKLGPGVFALITDPRRDDVGSNTGFVVTSAGVVVIDAGMPGRHWKQVQTEIRRVTEKQIVALILTHGHWDHTLATPLVAGAGVRVIAHEKTAESLAAGFPGRLARIEERGGELGRALAGAKLVLPNETVRARRELVVGDTRFDLIPFGPAHTGGDLAVLLPDQKVLFAGDLLLNLRHPRADDREMSVDGWQAALEQIEAMDVQQVVPGHGEVCDRNAARKQRATLSDLVRQARRGFSAGEAPEELVERVRLEERLDPAEVSSLTDSLRELYRRLAVAELRPPCRFELPPEYGVTEGGGDARAGWLRWGWASRAGYRDFEVMWRPARKGALGIEGARRNLREFNASRPQYGSRETGSKTLVIAGKVTPVLLVSWWFKEVPGQGGPAEWMVFEAGGREFAIQFGSNVELDENRGREAMAALEAVAATFRLE